MSERSRYLIVKNNKTAFIEEDGCVNALECLLKYGEPKPTDEIVVYRLTYDSIIENHERIIDWSDVKLGLNGNDEIVWFEYSYYDDFSTCHSFTYDMKNFKLEELFRLNPCANKENV